MPYLKDETAIRTELQFLGLAKQVAQLEAGTLPPAGTLYLSCPDSSLKRVRFLLYSLFKLKGINIYRIKYLNCETLTVEEKFNLLSITEETKQTPAR